MYDRWRVGVFANNIGFLGHLIVLQENILQDREGVVSVRYSWDGKEHGAPAAAADLDQSLEIPQTEEGLQRIGPILQTGPNFLYFIDSICRQAAVYVGVTQWTSPELNALKLQFKSFIHF